MPRRVLTKESIDQLLNDRVTEVALQPTDIVTALAKEYAQERGVRLVPASAAAASPPAQASAPLPGQADPPQRRDGASQRRDGAPPGQDSADSAAVHQAVRKAVIAALGHEPAGLSEAIARVMRAGPP